MGSAVRDEVFKVFAVTMKCAVYWLVQNVKCISKRLLVSRGGTLNCAYSNGMHRFSRAMNFCRGDLKAVLVCCKHCCSVKLLEKALFVLFLVRKFP